MKKQILLLFMAVFLLGMSQLEAQPILTPTPLTCVDLDDPLFVVAGHEYTYTVSVPAPPGTKTYHWFVTTDVNFMLNGALTADREAVGGSILASGSSHYDTPSSGTGDPHNTINLTWQSFTLDAAAGEYVFVVIYVENAGTDGCPTDNLKVYRIQTRHAFTLDIANIDPSDNSATTTDLEVCIDDVESAVFDPAADGGNGGVTYDFGLDTLFFIVSAANFSGAYQLSARLSGLQGGSGLAAGDGQTATIYWTSSWSDYLINNNLSSSPLTEDTGTILGLVEAPANAAVGSAGQRLYIKVVIEHHSFEAADELGYDYTLEIDGVLAQFDGTNWNVLTTPDYGDLQDPDPGPGACEYVAYGKSSTQVLLPRPRIETIMPDPADGNFLPITAP